MDYHHKLKQARKQKGLSQQEVADYLGYKSFTTIQKWEDGTSLPPLKVFQKLEKLYQLSEREIAPTLGVVRGGIPLLATQEEIVNNQSRYFYLRVVGDSMKDDRILEGDEILVRAQSDIENGRIGVVLIGDEATVKRIYATPEGYLLKPANQDYQNQLIAYNDDVRVLGEVVEVRIKV